jgi:hypothetical protein
MTGTTSTGTTTETTGTTTGTASWHRARLRPGSLVAGLSTLREEVSRQLKDPTPAYAALGASDAVARRVGEAARHGAAIAERVRRSDGVDATHLPRIAVGQALTVAGRLEEVYGEMATRGRDVVQRVRDGRQASELVRLAVVTINRARPDRDDRSAAAAAAAVVVVGETVTVTREADRTAEPTAATVTGTAPVTDAAPATAPETVAAETVAKTSAPRAARKPTAAKQTPAKQTPAKQTPAKQAPATDEPAEPVTESAATPGPQARGSDGTASV